MKIFKILYYAYKSTNNIYRSLIGYDLKNNMLNNNNSEFNLNNWNIYTLIEFISNIFFIKLPIHSPSWIPKTMKHILFGSNSNYIKNLDEIDENGNCFIYINGIMSNKNVVLLNKLELENLLLRPVNVIHNVTDSIIMDLIESYIGKETNDLTEASNFALQVICSKLLDKNIKKLIIICHSQGTIITSKLLSKFEILGLDQIEYLSKLELYCFANCTSNMKYIKDDLPYMEHFANEEDYVAKLGCNAPKETKDLINIDGKTFINNNGFGHMLNSHYLINFAQNYKDSKLLTYINSNICSNISNSSIISNQL